MATHDYVINNQSASAFRSDLNGALQAVVTQNSNAIAPATTYANMIWYDTANNEIKKRNEANSDWVVLGTINEGAGTFTPSGERALATLVQAEEGTNNTAVMTPLRVAQAIDALAPTYVDTVLLGTLTTTSGSTQTLSSLTLTPYKFLIFVLNNVGRSSAGGSCAIGAALATVNPLATVSGMAWVELSTGLITSATGLSTAGDTRFGATGYSTASTSVSITTSGTFNAGSVRIYGIK